MIRRRDRLLISLFAAVGFLNSPAALADQALNNCAINPKFIITGGMQQPVAIDTQQSRLPGVVIREIKGQRRVFRHPTWNDTGHIGATTRDVHGNIFAVPVPSIGLDTNPLAKRNTIYRIDSKTALMSVFVELPLVQAEKQDNPFGAMDIYYDCFSKSIYVSTVAGSTSAKQNGIIYQLDATDGRVLSSWRGVDAIGIAVHKSDEGLRLYFGEARSSSVLSIPLGSNGALLEKVIPRYELSLLEIKNGNSTQIRKIRFSTSDPGLIKLTATDTEFSYRLVADTSKRFRHYEFVRNSNTPEWKFLKIK